jgi:hypothetical protein
MGHFLSKLAREVSRLTGWRDKVFARRYQAIPTSEEEVAQVSRLIYILSHGCKEDLVERPQDWPGVHCVDALLSGQPLEGTWFDRTREFVARNRGEHFGPRQYATREVLELDPLPPLSEAIVRLSWPPWKGLGGRDKSATRQSAPIGGFGAVAHAIRSDRCSFRCYRLVLSYLPFGYSSGSSSAAS